MYKHNYVFLARWGFMIHESLSLWEQMRGGGVVVVHE